MVVEEGCFQLKTAGVAKTRDVGQNLGSSKRGQVVYHLIEWSVDHALLNCHTGSTIVCTDPNSPVSTNGYHIDFYIL